jgi:hypothetical protein
VESTAPSFVLFSLFLVIYLFPYIAYLQQSISVLFHKAKSSVRSVFPKMSSAMNKVAPAVRRLLASRSQNWSKQASKSFSSIVTRSTTIPSVFAFKQSSRASSTGSNQLVECLATEIQSELADDEIDNEFVDSKKQIEKLFTISDVSGQGEYIVMSVEF